MAGAVSRRVNAAVLILNHISSKFDRDRGIGQLSLLEDAKQSSKGTSAVAIAYDFMEILVPWMGFRSVPEDEASETNASSEGGKLNKAIKDWFGTPNE
jgi:hypothetical protein